MARQQPCGAANRLRALDLALAFPVAADIFRFHPMASDLDAPSLRLKTLGPAPRLVQVTSGGGEELVFGPGKPLALLIYLTMVPGRTASRVHLTDLLWADADLERARQSLRQAIWQIRRKLGDAALVADGEQVTLRLPLVTDYAEVGAALRSARFEEAVQLYEGDFLGEFGVPGGAGFEHWSDQVRARLRSGWMRALDSLARERLNRGSVREAIALARRLRDADPGDEAVWRFLLDALLLAGDAIGASVEADALEAFLAEDRREPELQTIPFLARVRAMPTASALASPSALTAELIGREGEFRRMTLAWERARAGGGGHLHLSARAGFGKTRLLRDAERRLRGMGGRILYLRAPPGTRQIAYAFAAEMARALIVLPGAAGVSPAVLSTLLALDPSLTTGYQGSPDATEGAEALRRRTLALAEVVLALSEEAPLALLLDDMHWVDDESMQVLGGLFARVSGAAALLVTAARPLPRRDPIEADAEVLALAPLSASQVEALVMSLGPLPEAGWSRTLIERLHEASGGSPHLVLESLQLALDSQWLTLDDRGWSCPDPSRIVAELPAGEAMRRRVEGLDGHSRRVLALLAVAASPLSLGVLAGAMGEPEGAVTALLAALELRGFVALGGERWRLGHDELAGAALQGLNAEALEDLARRVGAALLLQPSISLFDQQRAAALLVQGRAESLLTPLFRRWLAEAKRLRDPRTDADLARALLGEAATPERLQRILRTRPLRRRLGLITRRKSWGAAGAGLMMVGAIALVAGWGVSRPYRLVLLQAPLTGNNAALVPVPVVEVQDALGRRARGAQVAVRVDALNDSNGVVGVTTAVAHNGLVRFDRLSLGPAVSPPTVLRFSAEGLLPVQAVLHSMEDIALRLDHGELNGQELSPGHRVLTLRPGEAIQGYLTFRYSAFWPAAAVMLAAVPTWGDKTRDWVTVGTLATPAADAVSRQLLSIGGPGEPGDYRLILAFAAEPDGRWIASGTNWQAGAPRWNDGNDLADLTDAEVAEANAAGLVHRAWYFQRNQGYIPTPIAATVIEVRVR